MAESALDEAVRLLRAGRLVAFPTETVYGLGANALDPVAVARIYEAKGRPSTSPLIVHVRSLEMARQLVAEWPANADRLAARFWPGPLTLVLRRHPAIPDIVTAGLGTVGLRMPAHPLALALLRACGLPLAAPSANRFTQLSPVTAEQVRQGLGSSVDLVLDGGPCSVGIESTVVSLAGAQPVLLRPGMVTREQLAAVVGPVATGEAGAGAHASPGMHHKHYSPRTPLILVRDGELPQQGHGAYLQYQSPPRASVDRLVPMPADAREYAAALYDTLHRLDTAGYDWLAVDPPPDGPEWEGVHDRLRRAAARA